MAERPVVVVVAGTGTEVGKTWAAVALAAALRAAGVAVAASKPAQSFAAGEGPTDADRLAAATGQEPHEVCPPPRWYERPMAPPMAAAALGRDRFEVADLIREVRWPAGTDVALVESAGGVRSPLADDGDTVELVHRLAPDLVVLVADASLGTINSTRLAADALAPHPLVVLLNRFDEGDDLQRRNRDWLAARDGHHVVTSVAALAAVVLARLA